MDFPPKVSMEQSSIPWAKAHWSAPDLCLNRTPPSLGMFGQINAARSFQLKRFAAVFLVRLNYWHTRDPRALIKSWPWSCLFCNVWPQDTHRVPFFCQFGSIYSGDWKSGNILNVTDLILNVNLKIPYRWNVLDVMQLNKYLRYCIWTEFVVSLRYFFKIPVMAHVRLMGYFSSGETSEKQET